MRADYSTRDKRNVEFTTALLEYSLQSWNGNSHACGFIQSNFGFDTIKTTTTAKSHRMNIWNTNKKSQQRTNR